MGNKIDKICFCINANSAPSSTEEQKLTMHNNIQSSSQNISKNITNTSKDYQPANTSLHLNQKNNSYRKQFFILKNETRSHRTSNTTADSIYVGNYLNKKRNGRGKLILADQSYYEGNFKDGLYDGFGIFKNKNYIYKGEFLAGKKNGQGKLENFNDKSIYEGEFKDDLKDGYGEEKFSDGTIYKGWFKDGKKDGNGVLTLKKEKNISVYEGQFKNDKIWGKGKFKFDEKKEYNGEWENNEICGYGVLSENDIKHIGYFAHDKKEGYGASFFINKKFVLLGKWINDIMDGIAIIFPLSDNYEIKNEKIVMMKNDIIINSLLSEDEIEKIKSNKEYNDIIKVYQEKLFPEFLEL
jgi:hypothetical protein